MLDPSTFDLEEIIQIYDSKTGGQKTVWIARHVTFGRVALKAIINDPPDSRVLREVEILRSIDSPYYPKLFKAYNHEENGTNYLIIIEEFIEGTELSELIGHFTNEIQIKALAEDLLAGLDVLWSRNIVHRDIKPANIIIRPNSKPVILDLGIARQLDKETLTATCQLMGPCTPIYAAPEQLENRKDLIGPRTDMFSLGIVLYILATQRHPFNPSEDKSTAEIIDSIIAQHPPSPRSFNSELSDEFSNFILRLLQKQPFQRFRNCHSCVQVLTGDVL